MSLHSYNHIKVGIVILNYNHSAPTIECVDSILNIETHGNYEIIVVDNNSPSEIEKRILVEKLPKAVHLILNPVNRGYAAGNNVGCRFALNTLLCKYVLILNNDTLFYQPVLAFLLDSLISNKTMAAVSPAIHGSIDKKENNQVRRLLSLNETLIANTTFLARLWFNKRVIYKYLYRDYLPYKSKLYITDTINGAAFMMDGKVFKKINFLDERTFLYYEELILGSRLKTLGLVCGLDCRANVIHHQGLSTGAREVVPLEMFLHSQRSMSIFLNDHYGASKFKVMCYLMFRTLEYWLKRAYQWMN